MTPRSIASDSPGALLVCARAGDPVIAEVLSACCVGSDGYRPRVTVVSPDAADAFGDLRSGRAEIEVIGGPDADQAVDGCERALRSRFDQSLPGSVIGDAGDPAFFGAVSAMLERVRSDQRAELERLLAEIESMRRGRDRAWWGRRYAEALGGGEPLRVLVLSSRFSTFVRHAGDRLCGAVRASGHEAAMVIEPSDHAKVSAIAYARAHRSMDPDLVVSINWPRPLLGSSWPGGVPSVCWVQDMMPQLLDRAVGEALGELDFMVGQVHGSLFRDFGYPLTNRLFATVPACERTFAVCPDDPGDAGDRFACDVAYVSHQSGTPDDMIGDARRTMATDASVERVIDELGRAVIGSLGGPGPTPCPDLAALTRDTIAGVIGREPDPGVVSTFHLRFALPLGERVHRHVMLAWAREICAEDGRTLGLFGNGWDAHPELGAHARGPVAYGEELRRAYTCAGCHLHASLCTNAHQRVAECALAGGVMLRRGPTPDRGAILSEMVHRVATLGRGLGLGGPEVVVSVPGAMLEPEDPRFDAWRYGACTGGAAPTPVDGSPGWARFRMSRFWSDARPAWVPRYPLEQYPDWSFDSARETRFDTRDELRACIDRAISDRERITRDQGSRVMAHNTFGAFWGRLVRMLRVRLGEAPEAPGAGSGSGFGSGFGVNVAPALARAIDAIAGVSPEGARAIREHLARGTVRHPVDHATPGYERGLREAVAAPGTISVDGVGNGAVLGVLASREPRPNGERDAAYIIEPDLDRVVAALSRVDAAGIHADPGVRWFVGPGWASQLEAAFASNPCLPEPVRRLRAGASPEDIGEVWERVAAARRASVERDREAVGDGPVDVSRLAGLFAGAGDETARALVISSRFTTVLRHSAASMARALVRLGWDTRLLIEHADHERITEAALWKELAGHRPHAVFSIDHLRASCPGLPEGIPFICWVQDDLDHLTAPGAAGTMGPRDFIAGAWTNRYADAWGYPPDRCVTMARLTDFGPAGPAVHALRGEAHGRVGRVPDVAYISNHSAEPGRALDELLAGMDRVHPGTRVLEDTARRLIAVYDEGGSVMLPREVRAMLVESLATRGLGSPDEGWMSRVTELLCHRINNPLYRQQGLAWSAEACAARGLTLGVYGRGWDEHTGFASFARPPVAYGDALGRLMRSASFNLRLEPYPPMSHQRLLDACAADAFVISRAYGPWHEAEDRFAMFFLEHLAGRAHSLVEARALLSPERMAELETLGKAMTRAFPQFPLAIAIGQFGRRYEQGTLADFERSPLPPRYFETVFDDAASLGALLDRFADGSERESLARTQGGFVRLRYGYERGWRAALSEIGRRLGELSARRVDADAGVGVGVGA